MPTCRRSPGLAEVDVAEVDRWIQALQLVVVERIARALHGEDLLGRHRLADEALEGELHSRPLRLEPVDPSGPVDPLVFTVDVCPASDTRKHPAVDRFSQW